MKEEQDTITPGGYRFVITWTACLLLIYAVAGFVGSELLRGYKAETSKLRKARFESLSRELASQGNDSGLPSAEKPVAVRVGLNMNRIGDFALRESAWTADFNIFFRWSGDAANPGENFRVANGLIKEREKVDSFQSGRERYAEYHVVARVTRQFDASRFPFGEEGLIVEVEDTTHGVRYVADKGDSEIRSESMPRGLKLGPILVGSRTKSGMTGRGKPGAAAGKTEIRSQFIVGMMVAPHSLGIYIKLFQALLASVAVALIALHIKPIHIDCRFGLPVGGFFASVSNNIFVATLLPQSDRLTLADMVNATGLVTIFLILVQSAIGLYIFDSMGRERLSRLFDRVSFAAFLLGYTAVNVALPWSATSL